MTTKNWRRSPMLIGLGSLCLQLPAYAEDNNKIYEIDEIIVTVQKRAQSLSDVSASISAMTSSDIEQQQITNVGDLGSSIPNVSIGDTLGIAQITIRGLGLDSFYVGGEPSVAMHVDGAVISRGEAQLGSFFDLERVEILRGPSGTLYGRNATGGTVNLISKKPTEEWEGYVRATYGNYNTIEFNSAVGGPITEKLLTRIAYQRRMRDGFGKNLITNTDINDVNMHSVRGQLQYIFNPSVDFLLSAEYHTQNDSNYVPTPLASAFPVTTGPLANRADIPSSIRDIISDNPGINDRETWALTGTLSWEIDDQFAFTSLTHYRDYNHRPSVDVSLNAAPGTHASQNLETQTFSQEFQLNYTNDRLTAIAGLYYYNEKIHGFNTVCIRVLRTCDGFDPVADQISIPLAPTDMGPILYQNGFGKTDVLAAFLNVSYEVVDNFNVLFGARYSYEHREGDNDNAYLATAPIPNFGHVERNLSRFDPMIGFEWRPNEDLMVYANYKSAYKAGVFFLGNIDHLTGDIIPILAPEIVKGFEAGLKGNVGALNIALSAFTYDLTDKQVSRTIPASANTSIPVFENAAGASINGFELEFDWRMTQDLSFFGSLGYLDAKFTEFDTVNPLDAHLPTASDLKSAAGNRLPLAPKWSGTMRMEYETDINDNLGILFGIEALYKGDVQSLPFPSEVTKQAAYVLVNTNLFFTFEDQGITLNLWMRNLTDKTYMNSKLLGGSCRCILGIAAAPRTFGATVGFEF
ncbi:MAG: TonB-dependent receptor [Emcibacter sp.]|nr:TonB-dependent receptor [Emcibacter sp.]